MYNHHESRFWMGNDQEEKAGLHGWPCTSVRTDSSSKDNPKENRKRPVFCHHLEHLLRINGGSMAMGVPQ